MFIIKTNIYVNKETTMSDVLFSKETLSAIAKRLKTDSKSGKDLDKVKVTAIDIGSGEVDRETAAMLEMALNRVLKEMQSESKMEETASATTKTELDEAREPVVENKCGKDCDCRCDVDELPTALQKAAKELQDLFNKEDTDEHDDVEEIYELCEVEVPISVMLDVSLVKRLIKKAGKDSIYLDETNLLANNVKLTVSDLTDTFKIYLNTLEPEETIQIKLEFTGGTYIIDSNGDHFYIVSEPKASALLFAWASRNLMLSPVVQLVDDNDD